MKLATFQAGGASSWGVVEGDVIRDVGRTLAGKFRSIREVLEADALEIVRQAVPTSASRPLSEITWLPVIPDPSKILCVGLNYESHRKETGRDETTHPTIFTRFADSQVGHLAPILRPVVSSSLDYEGELAIIIGRPGRYIPRDNAFAHIAGYSCYNDATLRDWQRHTIQFTPGKNFPATGGFGPCLVTSEEIPDPYALTLQTRVNGTVVQRAGLDQLKFKLGELVEYCSSFTCLAPGDVIVTGTPGGVGFKRVPPLYLKPGDLVEVEISSVGILVNSIADEQ